MQEIVELWGTKGGRQGNSRYYADRSTSAHMTDSDFIFSEAD